MKLTNKSFGFKLWRAFFLFAAIIFAILWLLQTVLLQTCYTGMAISNLKKTANRITEQKDSDSLFDIIDEEAQRNSLLIFLTDASGEVLYSADEYSALYSSALYNEDEYGSSKNPYLSDKASLNWEKGAVRNLPFSHMELIRQLFNSSENDLGYTTEDGTAYVYGIKLDSCVIPSDSNIVMCISMPLYSMTGTAKILRVQLIWVSVLSLSLAFILAYFLSRRFEKPISSILAQSKSIAQGDFHAASQKGFCTELDALSDTLNETASSLERIEQSRQELLANISHDLRTPLTMIKGYAEMIREISWNDDEKRNHDLDIITREADRLTALVNEILEYSSMKSLNKKPEMTVFNLSTAVKSVIIQFDAFICEKGYTIEQSIADDVRIVGNQAQIERVIYNFIDNAINHTDNTKSISVSLFCIGKKAHFQVKDYGHGIPAEDIPYIWDKYYTSRNRKNAATVSGLGLSISKEILSLHEAQYGVECKEGCIFWFEIPCYFDN